MSEERDCLRNRGGSTYLVTALLSVLGVVVLVLAPVALLVLLGWAAAGDQGLDAALVGLLLTGFVAGIALGGLLLALGSALRLAQARLACTEAEVDKLGDAEHPLGYASEGTGGDGLSADLAGAGVPQLARLLSELQEVWLAPAGQRTEARERIRASRLKRAGEQIVAALNLRQLGHARGLLSEARSTFGNTPTLDKLAEKIDQAALRNEPLDFAHTRRLVEHAVHSGQWERAEQFVQTLWRDHPQSQRCRKLWEETRRARLYAHVQQSSAHHHWLEALAAAEEFLQRFPDSFEAETLRMQLETLQANAEIQQRKQYEERFKDLVAAKHYLEALRLAQAVIAQYPDSPQAGALRTQVPILERHLRPAPAPPKVAS